VLTYGPDIFALFQRSVSFVDRLLKGASPRDLPIEEPTQFELVVNLKTAKMLGLVIPRSSMERATKVIR
jgi:putative ABC transport system substrate-binding protein